VWETSPAGPFNAWAYGRGGFEYFYGFIGRAHQWVPLALRGTHADRGEDAPEEGYHFMADMTDKAIGWIGQQRALMPTKPFFVLLRARGANPPRASPRAEGMGGQVQGKFDGAGDTLREETIRAQKALGVIPPDCRLTARHKEIPAWDAMPEDLKPVLRARWRSTRISRVHRPSRRPPARFLKQVGASTTRSCTTSSADNGASAEGTLNGTYNEMIKLQRHGRHSRRRRSSTRRSTSSAGGVLQSTNRVGWAHAMNRPISDQAGRVALGRNAQAPSCMARGSRKGRIRTQFHHVIDVAPTSESGGTAGAVSWRACTRADPGCQHLYSRSTTKAARRPRDQYSDVRSTAGIYTKGWAAVTRHKDRRDPQIGEDPRHFDHDV